MIFGTAPGTASRVFTLPGLSVPAIINVPGFPAYAVAITSAGFSQDANVQFMNTLRKVIYVYSFGERMGTTEISGVAFYNLCSAAGGKGSGLPGLMSFYSANSVSTRASPLAITLAGTSVQGFVRAIRTTFTDTQHGLVGFSLSIATLPSMWG